VLNLRNPLCSDIITRAGGNHGKADKKHVSLGVAEGPQAVVVLLSSSVPQAQGHWDAVHNHWRRVVVKTVTQKIVLGMSFGFYIFEVFFFSANLCRILELYFALFRVHQQNGIGKKLSVHKRKGVCIRIPACIQICK
jgi:hypothetical protein